VSNCTQKNAQSLVLGFLYSSGVQMAVKAYQVGFCMCVNFFLMGKCSLLKKSFSFYEVLLLELMWFIYTYIFIYFIYLYILNIL